MSSRSVSLIAIIDIFCELNPDDEYLLAVLLDIRDRLPYCAPEVTHLLWDEVKSALQCRPRRISGTSLSM